MRTFLFVSFWFTCEAFLVPKPALVRRPRVPALDMARPDASAAIEKAQQMVANYGADSPEARLAWETVEEIDASDNSFAYQKTAAEECLTEETSPACFDYEAKLVELSNLLNEHQPHAASIRSFVDEIRRIRLADPSTMTTALPSGEDPSSDTKEFKTMLEKMRMKAEATSRSFGMNSLEARLAWAEYEEIASSGAQVAMGDRLDEMCRLEEQAMKACEALDELDRVLNLSKSKGQYNGVKKR